MIRSFEPGEAWFWDFAAEQPVDGPELAAAAAPPGRPAGARARADRVPADWQRHLH